MPAALSPPGERKAHSWLGGAQSLERPGKTQDSGFPALHFPLGATLTDGLPAVELSVEGEEHACDEASWPRWAAQLCPRSGMFSGSSGFSPPAGAPPLQGNRAHRGHRSNSGHEMSGSRICPHLVQELLSEAAVARPRPQCLHLPSAPLLPLPQAQSQSFQQRELIPTPGPCTCLPLAGMLWSQFTPRPLLREAVLTTLLRHRPLSLLPPHSPWLITHSISLYPG